MQIFLDSTDPKEILKARDWGMVDGVTTNPSLISKAGPDMVATLRAVVDASPGSVLCQAIGWDDKASLMAQARWLGGQSERIVVKLPMSVAGIQAVIDLKKQGFRNRLSITLVASVAQAYLCGKAGVDIVSVFNGPLDLDVDQPVDLVTPIRKIYNNYGFKTKILSCGRFPRSFGEFAAAGTDICTMKFEFLKLLYEHAFTDKRMNGFMHDWRAVFGDRTWPTA
jgi:transaldolase